MARVGCLGDIVFQVSADTIKTINNVVWGGEARYAEHKRHLNNSLTEFTGVDADTISFDMVLSVYLGVDPMVDIDKLWNYKRTGEALTLCIGERTYGKDKWVIRKIEIKPQIYDGEGNVIGATVSVDLLEYLR